MRKFWPVDESGNYYAFPENEQGEDIELDIVVEIHEHHQDGFNRWDRRKPRAFEETRIYISDKNESLTDNIAKRLSGIRPDPNFFRKFILPRVRRMAGIAPDVKIRWSSKAGCSMCPCSPGFIVTGERVGREISVTYEFEPTEAKAVRDEEQERQWRREEAEEKALEYVEEAAG